MEIQFKTRIAQQSEAASYWIDDVTEELLYGGAKGGGKSYLGAALIFGDALIYPETHYFVARHELTDLRKFTIPTIHEVFQNWGLEIEKYANFDNTYNVFNLYNKSKVFLIACKELPSDPLYERFGSMQMTRGWIEEGGEVAEAAKANLWLSVGRWKNEKYGLKKKLLITANPKKGWMKREFIDLHKKGELPTSKKYIQAFATDNVYLSTDYINSLKNEKDKVRRQRLWLGNWDYDDDANALISYDALTDLFTNTVVDVPGRYLTGDIARKGRDQTVLMCWKGWQVYKIIIVETERIDTIVEKVKIVLRDERIPYSQAIIDEGGVGGGVVDFCRGVKGFIGNASPLDNLKVSALVNPANTTTRQHRHKENFLNLRAQCSYLLADMVNERGIAITTESADTREKIIEDLQQIKEKEPDKEKKLQIIPKEEMKEVLGRSPDYGDNLMMRMYFTLRGGSGSSLRLPDKKRLR